MPFEADDFTPEQWKRAETIEAGMMKLGYVGGEWSELACALLTSANKAEREKGKKLVREWKHGKEFFD